MNRFVLEALFIGLKEGAKLTVCSYVLWSFFRGRGLEYLKRPLAAAVAAVFAASFTVMSFPVTAAGRVIIVKMIGYVFGLLYLLSLGALYHESGTDLLGPLRVLGRSRPVLGVLTFLLGVLYFFPDMAGSSLYLADLFAMAGRPVPVFAAAAAGFGGILALAYAISRRLRFDVTRLFGLSQLLLVLAMLKLLAGGVRGFAELSLMPTVQAGLTKLIHDVVHQTFVLIMVPDHMILSTTTWNFIGFIFGPTAGLWLSLIIVALPLIIFIRRHFAEPISVPADVMAAARRRIFIRAVRDQRVNRSLPAFLFLIVIAITWFNQSGEAGARLYVPDPKPVAPDGQTLVIPLQSTGEDLRDGSLHKFSLLLGERTVRLLVMRRPDGKLAVCLDACEICPPEGYGQTKEHVICIYCNTPIPFDTVGRPGGCNPIPLEALVEDKEIRVPLDEIAEKWALVNSKANTEGASR